MSTSEPRSESRQTPRHPVRLSAEVRHDGRTYTAVTRDLSVGGVCIEAQQVAPEGAVLEVGLFLVVDDVEDASRPPLAMRGKVAWVAPGVGGAPGAMGIRFDGLSAKQMAGITGFLKLLPSQ